MVRKLIDWAVDNPFLVILGALVLVVAGGYAFRSVNVEAYPDPAPAIVEVVAQYPGASAEEVERQVTIPLEVAVQGMPGLQTVRSKSLFGLSHLRIQFEYSREYDAAKQDVINRLAMVQLPYGIQPQISPASPIGEILRYTLENPRDADGNPVYTLADLKALQEYTIQRQLLRVPRVAGVTGAGGMVKRYEVHPDPDRLRNYGVTLAQLQAALGNANANGSGDNLRQGPQVVVVRSLGLFGNGQDPQQQVLGLNDPVRAAAVLRAEEARRCREIRQVVVQAVNNVPVRVDNLVDGGPVLAHDGSQLVGDKTLVGRGVVVSNLTRQGRVGITRQQLGEDGKSALDDRGRPVWTDEDDVVQGIVLLRKGQESLPALRDTLAKIEELNKPGNLLPGVKLVAYYNRTELINKTTETVNENLVLGMCLVTAILLMFLGNVRAAVIVAINIPLALLFAFGVLYARGKSANLLSIGAVDFGIIVDSSVIVVERIYHHLSGQGGRHLPLKERIAAAAGEVQRSLFFATLVMVCALLPLFTMTGPEGQIFGPMADTYAFALAGALFLSLTVSPVLCLLLLKNLHGRPTGFFHGLKVSPVGVIVGYLFYPVFALLRPGGAAEENGLVRGLRAFFLAQLRVMLRLRLLFLALFLFGLVLTGAVVADMGREFMPELEEGNLMVRGTFAANVSLEEVADRSHRLRGVLREFPEFATAASMIGRPDDGTDPTGYYNVETFCPLRPQEHWPVDPKRGRPRTKPELVKDLNEALDGHFPGVDWDISQIIRDNVMEALSGVKGENSIKIFGPDLDTLETLAVQAREKLGQIPGVENPGVFRTQGQSNLEFPVDRRKAAYWGVNPSDIQLVVQTAVGGKPATTMIEGGKTFDVTLRFPYRLRCDEQTILNIPVPVSNQVTPPSQVAAGASPVGGGGTGLTAVGTTVPPPSVFGSQTNVPPVSTTVPTRRLADLVSPLGKYDRPEDWHTRPGVAALVGGWAYRPEASFLRPGASTIYREQGQRLIAAKFEVRNRDLAGAVAEARAAVDPLFQMPYRAEWSGEFKQMQEAERRMARMFGLSMILVAVLLYMAFKSVPDALVVFANVLAMGVGGVWALKVAGLNFNISAAVGFISILGVAVMNGLLFVSAFNRMRANGTDLETTLMTGTAQLVRPVVMTALAAILGLLPAALSTKIGSQSQQPLAVVVVGGMLFTVLTLPLVPLLYSLYGHRTPPAGAGEMGH